jgi:hypothetical protein
MDGRSTYLLDPPREPVGGVKAFYLREKRKKEVSQIKSVLYVEMFKVEHQLEKFDKLYGLMCC